MGLLGSISPEGSLAIGIVVGLLSTSIQSLGLTLQRQSHLLEDAKPAVETRISPFKRPRWQAGMLMFVVSNLVGSTIQITTLPLPVLSTLQASGLVFNTAFATLLLQEPFTKFSLIGTILTVTGAALIAIFGAVAEPAHNLTQLLILLGKKGFIIWMAATLLVVVGTIIFAYAVKVYSSYKHMSKHLPKTERSRSNSKPDISSDSRSRRQSFTAQLPRPLQLRVTRLRLIRGLSYALISGILSAHSLLVAKSAVELLVRTLIDHNNQFNRFQSWLILLALLFFALSQLYYLHLGLRLCSTSVLYPFVFCIYNIIAILDGLIYFRQASQLTVLHGILVAVGTVILLTGVLALSWRLDDTTPTDPAPQVMTPQTPLTPGMGMFRSSDELERSPLVASPARASADNLSHMNERTPLLSRHPRRTTLTKSTISPGGTAAREIMAELDDDDDTYEFLGLGIGPRSSSPSLRARTDLNIPKKRRRASLPTKDPDFSDPDHISKERRSMTLQEYSQRRADDTVEMMKSSLEQSSDDEAKGRPHHDNPLVSSDHKKIARDRRTTVRFEEENIRNTSPRRSRFEETARSSKESQEQSTKKETGANRLQDPD